MKKLKINSKDAPSAVGPYSQAVLVGEFVFCSGQIGIDPKTNSIVEGGVINQARQVIKNLEKVLLEAGSDLSQVVKTEIFLSDMSNYASVNDIYAEFFNNDPQPARATVEVSRLPKDAEIEISCIAILKK